MREKREEMAIIKGVAFGLRDTNHPTLSFGVSMNGAGSLQCFQGQDIHDFIVNNKVVNIKELEGRPCIVETDGSMVHFLRLFTP